MPRESWLLMEEMNYNLLFRWFVGLEMDDAVWDVTVFTDGEARLFRRSQAGESRPSYLGHVITETATGWWWRYA